ncbi:hypothetical protein [Peptoniphilus sp. DNF00840]|uniref:hypothetical protein n=1 Tax=Peptoniphilus sp. DNF00840 TaxID=1477000 RepID=UPI000785E4D6|nr:hypothetical protein [Peptoniphilus sp. DNF00840]KXB69542.1 hypothetical protein HMPREF1864_01350 [Peptoniphilus sp. DNF00840]
MSKSKLSLNMKKENDVDNKLEEDRMFEDAKKFVHEHIDAFKTLGENSDRIMDKYDEAFKKLGK